MNAQIYRFDPACQTECEEEEKIFWKNEMMKKQKTEDRIKGMECWSDGVMEYWV